MYASCNRAGAFFPLLYCKAAKRPRERQERTFDGLISRAACREMYAKRNRAGDAFPLNHCYKEREIDWTDSEGKGEQSP